MGYTSISVREAMDRINAPANGWFLPVEQREYVWGHRHKSEDYVCLLMDSLLQRFPIGTIVIWETEIEIPYRKFTEDYALDSRAYAVDKGLWDARKSLVYDGQQRLQTLYSVLRHRFNGRTLHFDLLFDRRTAEPDETGFLFRDAAAPADLRYLSMTHLASRTRTSAEKVRLEEELVQAAGDDRSKQLLVRENLTALWDVYVDTNIGSMTYFSVKVETREEVVEIFRRLNIGGVSLTGIDLVLGRIKTIYHDYEERLWSLSERIRKVSGGIEFESLKILQFMYLMVRGTIRVSDDGIKREDIDALNVAIPRYDDALVELFQEYLSGHFRINHASIIQRWAAILPIAAYLSARKHAGFEYRIRALPEADIRCIDQFFLLSQFCDWNTQTMVNAFSRKAIAAGEGGSTFPLAEVRQIALEKNRADELNDVRLMSQPLLALKNHDAATQLRVS